MRVDVSTDRVTLQDWVSSGIYQIETVQFRDGTVWDSAVLSKAPTVGATLGNTVNESVQGSGVHNNFDLIGLRFGSDTIVDNPLNSAGGGVDTLVFKSDVAPSDVTMS